MLNRSAHCRNVVSSPSDAISALALSPSASPPHGAHDPRDVAQPLEVNGEVQRRAAQPSGVGKHVPQHFADDQRVGADDVRAGASCIDRFSETMCSIEARGTVTVPPFDCQWLRDPQDARTTRRKSTSTSRGGIFG